MRRHHGVVVMKTWPIGIKNSPEETWQVKITPAYSWRIDSNSSEGRYLSSSSALKVYYKCKGFVSFIWKLNGEGRVETPD